MNGMLVVMAILGCGDDGAACQMVRQLDTHYASVEACNVASPAVLEGLTDLGYPVVMAQCQKQQGPVVAQADLQPPR